MPSERRDRRCSEIARVMGAGGARTVGVVVGRNAPLEVRLGDLQRRVRDVHRLATLGGETYHAELDAIAGAIGAIKLELRGWSPRDLTTWRAGARPPVAAAPPSKS